MCMECNTHCSWAAWAMFPAGRHVFLKLLMENHGASSSGLDLSPEGTQGL